MGGGPGVSKNRSQKYNNNIFSILEYIKKNKLILVYSTS